MDGRSVMRQFAIGETPLIPLPGLARRGLVMLKAEYMNPFGSVKDRAAAFLLAWANEVSGPGTVVVESTSGNLGVALAKLGHRLGLRIRVVMDSSLPGERIRECLDAGAIVECVSQPLPGMTLRETRIRVAADVGKEPGHIWLDQYSNAAGMQAHHETTAPEIWSACQGSLDAVIGSVGTGGTICGVGAFLHSVSRRVLVVGVEPVGSTIFGGQHGDFLPAGSGMRGPPTLIQKFSSSIDRFAQIPDVIAARWAGVVQKRFGIEVGQTSGAAIAVAVHLAATNDSQVVALAPDRGAAFRTAMMRLESEAENGRAHETVRLLPVGLSAGGSTASASIASRRSTES